MKIPFTAKTVDSVMSAFTTAIADLNTVAERHTVQAAEIQAEREKLRGLQQAAEAEASRASAMSSKLSKLLGV